MKNLGQRYVQYINKKYRRSGTLWGGRFRSCLAQDENYVLTCYKYIELNPVRAAMVDLPGDYLWSSYLYNATGKDDSLITPHPNYLGLANEKSEKLEVYRCLVKAHLSNDVLKDIRDATNGNYVFGSNEFKERLQAQTKRRLQPGKPGRPKKWGTDPDESPRIVVKS